MDVKFPEVEVQLSGEDGNAFAVMAQVTNAMRDAGIPNEDINEYLDEVMAGDYDHLLQVTMRTVEVL